MASKGLEAENIYDKIIHTPTLFWTDLQCSNDHNKNPNIETGGHLKYVFFALSNYTKMTLLL